MTAQSAKFRHCVGRVLVHAASVDFDLIYLGCACVSGKQMLVSMSRHVDVMCHVLNCMHA